MTHRRAARRDDNEQAIVDALVAAGASVTHLGGIKGLPDLLVGYELRTYLFETKHASSTGKTIRRTSGGRRPDERGLTQDQQDWWAAWRGTPPVIVRTPAEALAAIGAPPATPPGALAELPAAGAPAPLATWRCSGCDLVYPDADGLELESGVAPPIHWTETPTRPWPLCPGFGKPGKPLAAIGAAP